MCFREDDAETELEGCPFEYVTEDVWQLIDAADLAKKGHWPVSGGWLEQTRSVVDGVRIVWNLSKDNG